MREPSRRDASSSFVAPPEYARTAREQAAAVVPRLTAEGREVLECAEAEARAADDDHVGTEHVVLGILALPDCVAARALMDVGITRAVFVEQRYEEEGASPPGGIPRTPRTNRVIGLAGEIARSRRASSVSSADLLLGVVAESEEWEASRRAGVHHLRDAAEAVGRRLADVREAVEKRL